jgi:hypothetical protein
MGKRTGKFETDREWWRDMRGNASRLVIFSRKDSDRIAERFVYCNLVMNVARGLDVLNAYWAAKDTHPTLAEYLKLLEAERENPQWFPDDLHFWAKINFCLAYDAWVRSVPNPQPSAEALAIETFDTLLTQEDLAECPVDPPEGCRKRNPHVAEAWKKWWEASQRNLIGYIKSWGEKPREFSESPRPIIADEIFTKVLPIDPLKELTWRKIQQTENCMRALRKYAWPGPERFVWIRHMSGLFNDLQVGRGLTLDAADRQELFDFLKEMVDEGLWANAGAKALETCADLNKKPLWRARATEVVEEWDAITAALRPRDLHRLLPWRDVLAYPRYLSPYAGLGAWQGIAIDYGL